MWLCVSILGTYFKMRFSEIIGQEKAKGFFRRVISEDRIPHAYLFTGIAGVGKTSTAIALTMALNCRRPTDIEACGVCPPCRQMAGGNFPDFISIKPDGQNIKIEQIREVNRRLSFAPVSARYRVCVIQQAEAMTREAANSFLKTLEEPPPGNILVLNAVEPLNLLPTIVSRCQRVPFQPLPVEAMIEWLVRVKEMDRERATIVGRASGGSLGLALRMSEDVFWEKRDVWISRILKLPSLSKGDALTMAMESATKEKGRGSDDAEPIEPGLPEMLALWGGWYRDLLIVKVGAPKHLMTNIDFRDQLNDVAQYVTIENLTASLVAVDQAVRDLRRMGNPQLVMGHTILGLQRLYSNET
ncbi:MAG: polymerase subunit delta [Thermodesulfobacteriota bacterium]|nr:polymerase subunit delta [Thermodesulfobacteriota bacterium]